MDLVHERRYIRVAGFLVEYDLIYEVSVALGGDLDRLLGDLA